MRHHSALVKQFVMGAAATLLLALGAGSARAQVPITFDDLDWTTDRGNIIFSTTGNLNAYPLRPGRNGANGNPADPRFNPLDSKRAVRRWVWPTTSDLSGITGGILPPTTSLSVTVDNPYFDGANGYLNKSNSNIFLDSTQSPDSLNPWTPVNGFTVPAPVDRADLNGFYFTFNPRETTGVPTDPPLAAAGDYGYTYAHHNDFVVIRGNNNDGPATDAELAALPNAAPNVYSAVHKVLINTAQSQPLAQWTLGSTLNANLGGNPVPAGTYNINLYSPGGGTFITHPGNVRLQHPNVLRAFARVSWGKNTVTGGAINFGTGVAGAGGVNDPTTSRIFLVDLSAPGYIPIGAAGQAAAVFPYDGNANDQIVVTLYSVTPDDPNDPTKYGPPDPVSGIQRTALVTADACQFTQENLDGSGGPGLGPLPDANASFIGSSGVISSPVVGSNKFAPRGVAGATQWYVARQELTRDVTPRTYVDPTNGNSLPIPDPTLVANVPVFYCLSNEDQLGILGNQSSAQPSKARVLWRFVGYPDAGSETVFASPVLANVRGRDGKYHTIVYFCGTNDGGQAGITGRIYALDAKGDPTTATTIPYWTYPSVRPLSAGEVAAGLYPAQYEDPNYNGSPVLTSTVYPTNTMPYGGAGHWWEKDQPLFASGAQEYYDGDIRPDTTNAGHLIVRTDTLIGNTGAGMGGIQGAPIVIDDPVNPGGPMLLVVPSVDGRLYTFDAGGRGDYTLADGTTIVPGTTQRIWTWPHFSADAYHHFFAGTLTGNPENQFKSESGKGNMPYSPAYDPTFPVASGPGVVNDPIIVTAGDGHVYGIKPLHDALTTVASNGIPLWNERRFWVYPHQGTGLNDPSADALFDTPGVPTIYRTGPTSATASINFTSSGRIYSLNFPQVLPASGYSTPSLRWVFPNTPNPPNQDPTDPSTFEYPQGFSAHGLIVVPQSITNGSGQSLPNDMVYALLNDGNVVGVNHGGAFPGTFYAAGTSLLNADSIDSAPIVTEIAPDPAFYSPVRNLTSVAQSVPALVFGDSAGGLYGFKLVSESNQDSTNPVNILPIIYARLDTSGQLAAPPALAASNFTSKIGGYYVVGDTNGQLRAYSFGFGQYGDIETVPNTEGTGNSFIAGDVSIDVRIIDAYAKADYDQMAQAGSAYGTGKTSARMQTGGVYTGRTATPLPNNLNANGTSYFAQDQGNVLYLVASGVYHAQPVADSVPNGAAKIATAPPTIKVTFTLPQEGGPSVTKVVTIQPTSDTDTKSGAPWPHKFAWPDDRAISPGEHDQLSIYGNDYSDPNNPPNPTTNPPTGAKKLTGRAQNVFPWIATTSISLTPSIVNGITTFSPNTVGSQVSVSAMIMQTLSGQQAPAQETAYLNMGQRSDQGSSNSAYPPDRNNLSNGNYQSKERALYITNPLSVTVRGYNTSGNNITDQTGTNSYNIIGWFPGVDNPNFNGALSGLELTGNGAYVGIGGATPGSPGTGVIKSIYAPFDMAQDNSSTTYRGIDNTGTRRDAFFIMDRSSLGYKGKLVQIRAHVSTLSWTGTNTSMMNPLPFDIFPINQYGVQSLDYPNLDARYATMTVNNSDALHGTATLLPATDDPAHPGDERYRIPHPTPVSMSLQIPKYFPANVNRGVVRSNFRGQNLDTGGTFTDQAGYIRGARQGSSGPAYQDTRQIVGPLNNVTGQADAYTNANGLVGSSPAAGYTGSIEVEMVPPGSTSQPLSPGQRRLTFNQGAGLTNRRTGSANGQTYRKFEAGIAVAPTFRMKVLENTLDLGNQPHGTGYSDLIANNAGYPGAAQYRYPFAPSATGSYATSLSPWDINEALTGLALGAGIPAEGQFFHPITLVSDSNINLVNLRVAKLLGIPSTDSNAAPNLGGIINNASLSQNPPFGVARAARLFSDQVNSLLSPPMIAAPFGMIVGGGTAPNYLGNIGIVSSFDHDSYAQAILGENNLYPIANPAVDAQTAAQSQDLFTLYGPALFGPAWAQNTQSRPTLHKPRPNDSTGTIASIPDKPYDYDYQANALNQPANPNGPSYIQQQQLIGLFGRPSVGMAIPIGTPVGTYSAPIFPYEDGLPIQWVEWLNSSTLSSVAKPANILGNNDDILNTTQAGALAEPYANPSPIVKVSVRESRLTEGATNGSMPQIDVRNNNGGYDPIGFNMQPSAIMVPQAGTATNVYNKIFLYWATNRQFNPAGNNGKYNVSGLPTPFAPYNLAYSSLITPYANLNGYYRGDADFGYYKGANALAPDGVRMPQWWSANYPKNSPFALLPGFDMNGDPLDYTKLFPQQTGSSNVVSPPSVRYGSPATTLATQYNEATGNFEIDPEAYLTAQGIADKTSGTDASGRALPQQTETRTFVASLANRSGNSEPGAPDYTNSTTDTWFKSFVNDPTLPKLSPRPLLVKLRSAPVNGSTQDLKFLYVFWFTGAQNRTSLYYNVNVQAGGLNQKFDDKGFQVLGDQKLSTPGALTWQSDPYPVFRRAYDPTLGQVVDAVDVMFTGQLKNRQVSEVMLARYRIVEQAVPATTTTPALAVGQLVAMPFPTVHQETLTPVPGTNTYAARDAAWFLPNDQQTADTAANRYMRIYLSQKGTGQLYLINSQAYINGGTNVANGTQRGRIDPASGLVYFNAVAVDTDTNKIAMNGTRPVYGGGQIVVDARSGTVSFPNIPPGKTDRLYASYTPYLLRVNTSRDESNVDRDKTDISGNPGSTFGVFGLAGFPAHPAVSSSGQNYSPTFIMDRAANFRGTLQSPQVLFGVNNQPATSFDNQGTLVGGSLPPVARMWAFYRKTDAAGSIKGTVFLKSLRLTARLPLPVATIATTGTATSPLASQRIQFISVLPADPARPLTRGYEVDWVRGRVYFQEEDEGNLVKINYQYYNPRTGQSANSGDLYYRVAWSDEISAAGVTNGDQTTPEVAMPTSSVVNEGQIAAFKDPYIDKVWLFWSSTRAGTTIGANNNPLGETDLYYETLAPQFYPSASNQY